MKIHRLKAPALLALLIAFLALQVWSEMEKQSYMKHYSHVLKIYAVSLAEPVNLAWVSLSAACATVAGLVEARKSIRAARAATDHAVLFRPATACSFVTGASMILVPTIMFLANYSAFDALQYSTRGSHAPTGLISEVLMIGFVIALLAAVLMRKWLSRPESDASEAFTTPPAPRDSSAVAADSSLCSPRNVVEPGKNEDHKHNNK